MSQINADTAYQKPPEYFENAQAAMRYALSLAQHAGAQAEIPIAALVTMPEQGAKRERLITSASNSIEREGIATFHAELLAIQQACRQLNSRYLQGCHLYVTLEPCAMCAGAIAHARLARLYFAAYDPKSGGVDQGARVFDHPQCHHKPEVIGGLLEQPAQALLQDFFQTLRR